MAEARRRVGRAKAREGAGSGCDGFCSSAVLRLERTCGRSKADNTREEELVKKKKRATLKKSFLVVETRFACCRIKHPCLYRLLQSIITLLVDVSQGGLYRGWR